MAQDIKEEFIIRQHRHWTRWLQSRWTLGEGNLVLTNRRLLFLHRIESSPEVTASIKKLADAPIETVLNHALTLHKKCFQIPLSSITGIGIGAYFRPPFPYCYLKVSYLKGKQQIPQTVAFQFKRPKHEIMLHQQLITDLGWKRAIRRAIRETALQKADGI